MAKRKKRYGYITALWEILETVPSLFRKISDYKKLRKVEMRPTWKSMIQPSYLPWPLRLALGKLPNRDAEGNRWNLCHFWSNFEIAEMSFFRSPEYRRLFEYLDADGGFYYERVSDHLMERMSCNGYTDLSSGAMPLFTPLRRPSCWTLPSSTTLPTLDTSMHRFSIARTHILMDECRISRGLLSRS